MVHPKAFLDRDVDAEPRAITASRQLPLRSTTSFPNRDSRASFLPLAYQRASSPSRTVLLVWRHPGPNMNIVSFPVHRQV